MSDISAVQTAWIALEAGAFSALTAISGTYLKAHIDKKRAREATGAEHQREIIREHYKDFREIRDQVSVSVQKYFDFIVCRERHAKHNLSYLEERKKLTVEVESNGVGQTLSLDARRALMERVDKLFFIELDVYDKVKQAHADFCAKGRLVELQKQEVDDFIPASLLSLIEEFIDLSNEAALKYDEDYLGRLNESRRKIESELRSLVQAIQIES